MGKVIGCIVDINQVAFFPGKHLHDHVLFAYERRNNTLKCMLQVYLQKKAYDMVDCHALE